MSKIAHAWASLALGAALLMGGCSTMESFWKDTWRDTKDLYKQYINTNPTMDLEKDAGSREEKKLAALMTPMDMRLEELRRFMDGKDMLPQEKWFQTLFSRFPWISGVAVLDTKGKVAFRHPDVTLKPLDYQPLLDLMEDATDRRLRVHGDMTPLGPEIFVAAPFYQHNEWKGMTVVHFDPRSLVRFCPDPDSLVLLTPTEVLWRGGSEEYAVALSKVDWASMLREDVADDVDVGDVEFAWLARYLGNLKLIYATARDRD